MWREEIEKEEVMIMVFLELERRESGMESVVLCAGRGVVLSTEEGDEWTIMGVEFVDGFVKMMVSV